jgi:hypothetical protein
VLEIAIISGLLGVIAALLGKLTFFNGTKVIKEPNPHPDETPMGSLSASYWLDRFQRIEDKMEIGFDRVVEAIRDK